MHLFDEFSLSYPGRAQSNYIILIVGVTHYGNQSPPQLRYSSKRPQYRPLTSVGIARCTVLEGIQFPHTCCHFVGHWNSSNIHVDLLLAPYQQY